MLSNTTTHRRSFVKLTCILQSGKLILFCKLINTKPVFVHTFFVGHCFEPCFAYRFLFTSVQVQSDRRLHNSLLNLMDTTCFTVYICLCIIGIIHWCFFLKACALLLLCTMQYLTLKCQNKTFFFRLQSVDVYISRPAFPCPSCVF